MNKFFDMVAQDNRKVFLNLEELATLCTLSFDGEEYAGIPVSLSTKEEDRERRANDHMEGVYRVSTLVNCLRCDLGGNSPEQGGRLTLRPTGESPRTYYVVTVAEECGMLRMELEGLEE